MTATAPPSPVIDPSPGSSDARRGWNAATERQHLKVFQALAELGVLALALGTTASLNRLFIGWSFLGSLAIPVVGSWLTALVMRRLRVPVLAALAVSILVGVVVLTLQFAPGTSMVGLPTGRSIDAVRAALDESFGGFNRIDRARGRHRRIPGDDRRDPVALRVLRRHRSVPLLQPGPGRRALRGRVRGDRDPRPPVRPNRRRLVLPGRSRDLRRDPTRAPGDRAALDPVRGGQGSDRGRDRSRRSRARGPRDRSGGEPVAPRHDRPRPRPAGTRQARRRPDRDQSVRGRAIPPGTAERCGDVRRAGVSARLLATHLARALRRATRHLGLRGHLPQGQWRTRRVAHGGWRGSDRPDGDHRRPRVDLAPVGLHTGLGRQLLGRRQLR